MGVIVRLDGEEQVHLLPVYDQVLHPGRDAVLRLGQPEGLHIIVLHGGGQAGRPADRLGQIRQKGNPSAGPSEGRRQVHQQYECREAGRQTAQGDAEKVPFFL